MENILLSRYESTRLMLCLIVLSKNENEVSEFCDNKVFVNKVS